MFSRLERDLGEVGVVLALLLLAKLGKSREPWWRPDYSDKGGRGAGKGSTRVPVPQGATNLWSEDTMRLFVQQMRVFGLDPEVVLLGIAAASNFNADEQLGGYTGLLLVSREDLSSLGYPGVPTFEELDAPHQIPWIARVIGYRIAASGAAEPPKSVPELAVLLHKSENPTVTEAIRNEAARRAKEAAGTMLYLHHKNLLQHVLATPQP